MQIDAPRHRPTRESVVPMINVVFLLLVFFLMTSQIAPPDPVEVSPPQAASGDAPHRAARLFVSPEGTVHFRDLSGAEALAALAALAALDRPGGDTAPLLVSADGGVEAARLAAILRDLAAIGVQRVDLAVVPR